VFVIRLRAGPKVDAIRALEQIDSDH